MKGVFIVLMGTSGCGKSHTAKLIRSHLLARGVREDLIHHLQRDEYILKEGAKLLARDLKDVSYADAYEEISRVHEREIAQGNEGIKAKVHLPRQSPLSLVTSCRSPLP
jgi:thymidylate kinase